MLEFLKRRWWQAHYTEYVPSVPIAKQHVWDCNFQQYLVTPLRSFEVCREAQISKIMRLHNRPPKLTLRQHWWETCTIPHHSAMCAIRCGDVYFYVHDLGWTAARKPEQVWVSLCLWVFGVSPMADVPSPLTCRNAWCVLMDLCLCLCVMFTYCIIFFVSLCVMWVTVCVMF